MDNMVPGDTTAGENTPEGIRRKRYSEVVIEGVRKFVLESIVGKADRPINKVDDRSLNKVDDRPLNKVDDSPLNKVDDVVVCFPVAKLEAITEGSGQGRITEGSGQGRIYFSTRRN